MYVYIEQKWQEEVILHHRKHHVKEDQVEEVL